MSDHDTTDPSRNVLGRQAFARVLGSPKVFGAAFLPPERAEWRGDVYTLGKALAKTPKGQFTGVRLQAGDRRNLDQSRERAVQQDLVNLIRSIALFRTNPAMRGVVLSRELLQGRDPAGVRRVQFGLSKPSSNDFVDDSAAATECYEQILRAIRGAGLRVASAPPFDAARGFGGLEAWAGGLKLRQSKLASATTWGKVAAVVAAVGAGAWMVPSVAAGISSRFAALREFLLPTLAEVRGVDASDGQFTDKVEVEWAPVPKATGYSIYRDDVTAPLARVRGHDTVRYEDLTAPAGKRMKYIVQATSLLTSGGNGYGDEGFRNVRPPEGVAATDGTKTDCVEVTWSPVEHATGYEVFREEGRRETRVCATSETSCKDTQAPAGKRCRYTVRATTAAGASEPSSPPAVGMRCPPKPDGLVASDGTDSSCVQLRWNQVPGAESYEIERTCPDRACQPAAPQRVPGTSYADKSADPGQTYAYQVKAVCPDKTSDASDPDEGWRGFVKPVAKATDGDFADRVQIRWNAVPGASGYQVFRDDATQALGSTDGNAATTFDDRTAKAHVKHAYRVRAVTTRNDVSPGDPDQGWRSLPAPDTVKASRGDTEKVVIEWEAVSGVDKYQVLRDKQIVHTTTNADERRFEDRGAEIGRLYGYSVASMSDRTGGGPASDPVDGYRNLKPPQDVVAAADGNRIVVTWKVVDGATGYEVFRSDQDKDPVGFARGHDAVSWADRQVPRGQFTYSVKARTDTVTGPPSGQTPPVTLGETRPVDADVKAEDAAKAPPDGAAAPE